MKNNTRGVALTLQLVGDNGLDGIPVDGDLGHITDGDTEAMDRFEEVAATCQRAGLTGIYFSQDIQPDGRYVHRWGFDVRTRPGRVLNALWLKAARGVAPPPAHEVLATIHGSQR